MRRFREFSGCKVHGENDIKSGKRTGRKVQTQPIRGNFLQGGIVLTVEDAGNLVSAKEYHSINSDGKYQHCDEGVPEDGSDSAGISSAVVPADDRLDSLSDSGIDSNNDQGQVGDHSICCNTYISFQCQDNSIEHDDHNAGGYFGYQGRDSAGQDFFDQRAVQSAFYKVELIFFPDKMRRQNQHAENRSKPGGENGSKDTHLTRKDEDPVQYHI